MPLIETIDNMDWDSRFFGFDVARIDTDCTDECAVDAEIRRLQRQGAELIYVFSAYPLRLCGFNAMLVDQKLSYVNTNPVYRPVDKNIVDVSEVSRQLYELGCQAGGHSRYKVDPNIKEDDFRRMFRLWVDNSVSRQFADYVFAYEVDGEAVGFVTAKVKGDELSIGLIATDENYRGCGIGGALIQTIVNLASELHLKAEVTTQADNVTACRFYERHGFNIASRSYVYHVWSNNNENSNPL